MVLDKYMSSSLIRRVAITSLLCCITSKAPLNLNLNPILPTFETVSKYVYVLAAKMCILNWPTRECHMFGLSFEICFLLTNSEISYNESTCISRRDRQNVKGDCVYIGCCCLPAEETSIISGKEINVAFIRVLVDHCLKKRSQKHCATMSLSSSFGQKNKTYKKNLIVRVQPRLWLQRMTAWRAQERAQLDNQLHIETVRCIAEYRNIIDVFL